MSGLKKELKSAERPGLLALTNMDKKMLVVIRKDTGRNDEAYFLDWWSKDGTHFSAYEDRLTLIELKADYKKGGYKIKVVNN